MTTQTIPRTISPSPPYNSIVAGTAGVVFAIDFGGLPITTVSIQIRENRTDGGGNIYYLGSVGGLLNNGSAPYFFPCTSVNIPFGTGAFSAFRNTDGYQWRAAVNSGSFSSWQLFFVVPASTSATILSPNETYVGSRQPSLVWTQASGMPQTAIRTSLTENGVLVYDSGATPCLVPSGGTGYMVIPFDHTNGFMYTLTMQPMFSNGVWQAPSAVSYITSIQRFEPPEVYLSVNDGVVTIACGQYPNDPEITSHSLYRWSAQRQKYILIADGLAANFIYADKVAPINAAFWYRIISHASSTNTSDVMTTSSITTSGENWVITDGVTRYVVVVTDATFGRQHVLDEMEPLGRKFKVVSRFESSSREGKVTIDLSRAERDVLLPGFYSFMEHTIYILSPYGETVIANLTDITVDDDVMGRGSVTLSYIEEVES